MASLLFQLPSQLYPKPNLPLSKTNSNPLPTLRRKPPPNCTKQDQPTPTSRHFILVHGMSHGGWAWYKLATLLNEAGHHVTAPDLAASGLHPKRMDEVNTFEEYCEPLMEVMESVPADERVVLVGHSYGGIPVSLAMERFPHKISVAVFVNASMPSSTNSLADITKEVFWGKDFKRPIFTSCSTQTTESKQRSMKPKLLFQNLYPYFGMRWRFCFYQTK